MYVEINQNIISIVREMLTDPIEKIPDPVYARSKNDFDKVGLFRSDFFECTRY